MARSEDKRFSIYAIIFGFIFVYSGVHRILKRRKVADTASNSIAHAPQGHVEFQAFAWPLTKPVTTNHSGKLCAYYKCKLERYERSGKSGSWRTCWEYCPQTEFLAIDSTGVSQVDVSNADITCTNKKMKWKNVSTSSEIFKKVTAGYGKINTGWFSRDYRIVESFILLGSPCYLQGVFHTRSEKQMSACKGVYNFQAYLRKRSPGQVHDNMKFDNDGDGKVTSEEVQKFMYKTAKNIAQGFYLEDKDEVQLKISGMMSSTENQKLIVADMHEHHFLGHLGPWNLLRIFGGAALVSLGVVSLFW